MDAEVIGDVWRREAPHVLAALVRRYQDVDRCEDAAQDALEAALSQWPVDGLPLRPRGWLIRVASRRVIDGYRRDEARRMREHLTAMHDRLDGEGQWVAAGRVGSDTTLEMLLLCCHPALTPETQVILSLHTVVGLSATRIADLLFLTESTAGQRISRAKATIRRVGGFPAAQDARDRLANVLRALYLMFTQGHTVSRGDALTDLSMSAEAIRLTRTLRSTLPHDSEVCGLLALMLLTEARQAARCDADGELIPLREQDRDRWDRNAIVEGVRLLEWALPRGPVGPYQVQAAISAVHAEALTWETTDWPQILLLYRILDHIAPSATVSLNLAVAVAMTVDASTALADIDRLAREPQIAQGHRFHATRAHLLEQAGRLDQARQAFEVASELCLSSPERRYLQRQRDRVARLVLER